MYYLYGSKPGVAHRLVATFDTEPQLDAYVGWATLKKNPDGTAITGNVFKGPPVLAARRPDFSPPAPAPMNKWEFFNAKI